MRVAVLDTCVLVPSLQRDFLLQLADQRLFRVVWSSGTLSELEEVLSRLNEWREKSTAFSRPARLITRMQVAFPGSTVDAPRDRGYGYGLADRHDEHILHAAILSNADVIVSDDKRAGFDRASPVLEGRTSVVTTSEFITEVVSLDVASAGQALEILHARRRFPKAEGPKALLEQLCRGKDLDRVQSLLAELL